MLMEQLAIVLALDGKATVKMKGNVFFIESRRHSVSIPVEMVDDQIIHIFVKHHKIPRNQVVVDSVGKKGGKR